jgi:hypothetical protein
MSVNLHSLYVTIRAGVAAYPGGVSAVLGVIVALAARYGFNLTVTELMGVYAAASALVGGSIHFAVKAVAKSAVKSVVPEPTAKDLS